MKKIIAAVTALTVGSMMLLSGCGSSTPYDYDLTKYITVGDYAGLEYDKPEAIEISQAEIDKAVKADLEAAKYLSDVEDGKVHDGDTVIIDYVGTMDGTEFEGGSATDASLTIGSGQFIDGFEDGLIGHSVGDEVTLDLTFPDPYENNPDLAGKAVQFKVTVNKSQEYVTPTEKRYVKNNTDYKSIEEYEKAKEKELYNQAEDAQKQAIRDGLWKQIQDSAEVIEFPEKEVTEYKDKTRSSIEDYAKENDMEFADILKNYYGMTEEEFEEQIQTAAEANCKDQMIVYHIAKQEGFEVSDEEYKEFVDKNLAAMGYTADQFKEYTGQSYEEYVGGEDYIKYYMMYTKVMDFVVENAKEK